MNVEYLLQKEPFLVNEKNVVKYSLRDYPYQERSMNDLHRFDTEGKTFVPIGSVEFTREFARINGIVIPPANPYPFTLRKHLGRSIRVTTFERASSTDFVKPVAVTKQFNGGIKGEIVERVNPSSLVFICEPVVFEAEFRVYVHRKQVRGLTQYDDGEVNLSFDVELVASMIEEYYFSPVGYALDVGIMNGKTVLVEVNDGWSLGYYQWGTMNKYDYVDLITDRWLEIMHGRNHDEIRLD